MTLPNVVAAEVSTPVVLEEAALVLMEGVVKGVYPVDITPQPTVDLTSAGQSDSGSASSSTESGLEPDAVAQLGVLDKQECYSREQDFPSSITEVIQPMEKVELVDILPTLSLIEEENPSCPPTPSVMDMIESFGLGIGDNSSILEYGSSDLIREGSCQSQPSLHCNKDMSSMSEHCENTVPQEQDCGTVNATAGDAAVFTEDVPPQDVETQKVSSKGALFPVRNQVEWERPSNSSS